MTRLGQDDAGRAITVDRVGQNVEVLNLIGQQVDADRRVGAVRARGLAEPTGHRQPGLRFDRDGRLESVLTAVHRLMGVLCRASGFDDADHPVRCDPLGDPPARWRGGVVGVGDELHVLASDQRQKPDRVCR